jgi:transposase
MPASRDTFLRELRRLSHEVTIAPPVVVGIDDWAITRGHRYGTIVVDLERRCPIEVLDGRESTGVADWLQRHPSIQVVARDRAGAYSDAAKTMTPQPQQVADDGIFWVICTRRLNGCCCFTTPSCARPLN